MVDTHTLQRFVIAQDAVYDTVISELKAGRKTSHWMWFIFPQIAGLGYSPMAITCSISSKAEAEAYLSHPTLGGRLRECAQLVLQIEDRTSPEIFGGIDAIKLRSCMTLFAIISDEPVFRDVLRRFYDGKSDQKTLGILNSEIT